MRRYRIQDCQWSPTEGALSKWIGMKGPWPFRMKWNYMVDRLRRRLR